MLTVKLKFVISVWQDQIHFQNNIRLLDTQGKHKLNCFYLKENKEKFKLENFQIMLYLGGIDLLKLFWLKKIILRQSTCGALAVFYLK